jgi:hypothetical protein
MSVSATSILATLEVVERERGVRAACPDLAKQVGALKSFQQGRFSHTYADLLQDGRYGPVARFFLDELYGPTDFTRRDAQFSRAVPSMVRLFPREVVETVADLAQLHALSEQLDTEMAHHVSVLPVTAMAYLRAWRATGRADERQLQVELTLAVANRLDRFTRKPLLRNSLRLMRAPARAAGLGELQQFLETGFDTFRAMKGAEEFVRLVQAREQALASALFFVGDPDDAKAMRDVQHALSLLPEMATASRTDKLESR